MRLLVNLLGWVPVLGEILKIAYVSNRAAEVVGKVKLEKSEVELKGAELDKILREKAEQAYEEFLKPEVDELGLPEIATTKASEKAIDVITAKLVEKYSQKVS